MQCFMTCFVNYPTRVFIEIEAELENTGKDVGHAVVSRYVVSLCSRISCQQVSMFEVVSSETARTWNMQSSEGTLAQTLRQNT